MKDCYVLLKEGKQKDLIETAISLYGSERKLSKFSGIPHQSINFYRNVKHNLPKNRLLIILKLIGVPYIDFKENIVSYLDKDWGRKEGGVKLIEYKKLNGDYEDYLNYLRNRGSKIFGSWHKNFKRNNKKEYYEIQHERFRKSLKSLSKRSYTKRGEKVRNILEKEVADFLFSLNLKYEYEPFVKIDFKGYFPDFMIGNLIIECTMWKGDIKLSYLRKKIKDFKRFGYKVRLVIPEDIAKFYKCFKSITFTDLSNASVAQTILELSK